MALDINGYNTDFNAFVKFAQNSFVTNDKTAVARFEVGGAPLGGRLIVAANPQFDKVGKFRNQIQKDLNNEIRTAFRNAIINMFGGESRIPDSVKDAMLLKDYGKGKPLTARRIMAVKAAIDKDGSVKLNTFRSADAATVALNKGWNKEELPQIARAARFLSDATGVDEFTAIEQLSTPGSKANRLMNYGGRFMDSATSFANGLRLMDSFKDWYTNIFDTMKPVHKQERNVRDFSPADTFTKLNIDGNFIDMDYLQGFEKFAFEELAANPKANLAETDMEKLFGFKDNKAMAFIGTGYGNSFYSTIANVPKEKRAIIYTALNAFTVPAKNAQEAHNKNMGNRSYTKLNSNHAPVVIARLVKNFDKAEAMFNAGKLTAKNIIKEFFSEIPEKGDYDYKTLNNYFDGIDAQLALDEDEGGKYTDVSDSVVLAMQNSGCTFEETVQMLRQGQMPPVPKFLSTGSMRLKDFDGTVNGGRDLIGGDLNRPDFCYHFKSNLEKPLLAPGPQQPGFGFKFPDEGKFFTNASEQGKANITRVADKVVAMCGSVHVAQSNAVMTMLSQSGLSNLRGGLPQIGVTSNEHAPVDYTITKNDETGDITIKYTSPEALPFKFEWTATVDISGNVTTTPIRFTDATALATLKRETTEAADKLKESTLASYREKPDYDQAQEAITAKEIDKAVNAIFSGVGADRDMLTLLQTNKMAEGVLLNAAQRIRSPEKIAKTVAGLKENLDELRAAANGNQRIFDVGLKRIAKFGGAPLKSGLLTKMCEMIAKEDLGAFRNLSAASSPEKIMDAMCRLDRLIAKIFDETEILKTIGEVGGAETTNVKGLVMGLVFAHCDEDTANGIKSAMHSQNTTNLVSVMVDMGNGKFPPGANVDPQTRMAISDRADSFQFTFIGEMYIALNESLGVDIDDVPWNIDKKTPVSTKSVNAILDTIKEYTLEMEERQILRANLDGLPPQGA